MGRKEHKRKKQMKDMPHTHPSHFPKSKKEESEYGPGKEDIIVCEKCHAVYYYKSWHHHLRDYPELSEEKALNFDKCPACRMIENGKYEGELTVEGIKSSKKEMVKNAIENMGEESFNRDSQHRIISIEEPAEDTFRVLTTENQLAVRIGKKVAHSFDGEIEIKYSEESTTRVTVQLQ